ncbi:MAG: hypothetical protein LBD95_06830 [Clostridiales Family XIII bacterium]|jgi:virulence-associated protein VapD|nr:hypothetical protein [Clostridiales Family XIII bacterium]
MATGRKQVAFDMDTAALKKHYPNKSWEHAYDDVRRYMTNNGFRWQQGSVYVSTKPVDVYRVAAVISALIDKNPWLNDGVSPPPLQAAGFNSPSCQWRVQSPTDAYVFRGGGQSPCPLKTSVQQLKCAFGASILDGAKIECMYARLCSNKYRKRIQSEQSLRQKF